MKLGIRIPPVYPIVDITGRDEAELEADAVRGARLAIGLAEAGATLLQLRAKTLPTRDLTRLASALGPRLGGLGCMLIINDRPDVARAANAAGVHLGDEDLAPDVARTQLGALSIIGYSTHSVEEARAAAEMPVDYIGFGPVFESPTKAGVREPRGLEALAAACEASPHPVVAIGGITRDNATECRRAGAASVAVITDLATAEDPAARLRDWLADP